MAITEQIVVSSWPAEEELRDVARALESADDHVHMVTAHLQTLLDVNGVGLRDGQPKPTVADLGELARAAAYFETLVEAIDDGLHVLRGLVQAALLEEVES